MILFEDTKCIVVRGSRRWSRVANTLANRNPSIWDIISIISHPGVIQIASCHPDWHRLVSDRISQMSTNAENVSIWWRHHDNSNGILHRFRYQEYCLILFYDVLSSSIYSILKLSFCIVTIIALAHCSQFFFPGPLFTKRTGVLPQDLVKSRSREIRV